MSIIVNDGKVQLLQAQISYLQSVYLTLFTNNVAESGSVVWGTLTEAGWAGYARVLTTPWSAAALSGSVSLSTGPPCTFTNTSGAPVNYYGWALYDSVNNKLVGFANLGLQTLANGATITYTPTMTDDSV